MLLCRLFVAGDITEYRFLFLYAVCSYLKAVLCNPLLFSYCKKSNAVLNIRKYLCKITTKIKTSNLGRLTIEITKISIHSQKLTNYKTVTKRLQNGNKFSLCIFTKNGTPNLFDISKNGNYNCLELRKEPIIKRQWVASG